MSYSKRYIESVNRKGLSYTLAVNHLADRSDEELKILRGKLKSSNKPNNGLPFDMSKYKRKDLPERLAIYLNFISSQHLILIVIN